MIKNVFLAIKAYTGTFALINHLKLWKYFAVPIGISFITALGIAFAAYGLSDNLAVLIQKLWPWEWGSETFQTIGVITGALIIIAVGLILYKHTVMALSAPFMGPVSEKIEAYLLTAWVEPGKSSFMAQLWRGIRINTRNLLMELFFSIPIFILGFIPIVGFLSAPLLFLLQSYYAGFGNMDYTLERHYSYNESVRFVSGNRGLAIGNGSIFMLMLLIPVIGIILVLPLSVTAATTETLKRIYPSQEFNVR